MSVIIQKTVLNILACPVQLRDAINANVAITAICLSVTINNGINISLEFNVALSTAENASLDTMLTTFSCTVVNNIDYGYLDNMWQLSFVYEHSDASNRWLSCRGSRHLSSNQTPAIVPFKSKLVGLTFSNRHPGISTEIKIYSTPEGGSFSPKTVDFIWTLNNIRVSRKTDFATDILFDAGEKIGVYIKDTGKNPGYVVVDLYFLIINNTFSSGSENYSGSFATGPGGGSK